MKNVEVWISCMHQQDMGIAERTGCHAPVLIINQTDHDGMQEENGIRMLSSAKRGLSVSRNTAIEHAKGEIGLLCDDDEQLFPFYDQTILDAYERFPEADLICFGIANQPSRLAHKTQKLNRLTVLRIASWQITMKVSAVRGAGVRFDERMGAGTGNGAGEEVKFLRDCIAAGLAVYYVPEEIGTVANSYYETGQSQGTWFTGFDETFFYNRGMVNRYMLGLPMAAAYAVYYTIVKRNMYQDQISMKDALKYTLKGIRENRLKS